MDIHLTPIEARVLGVLIEKAETTPDGYPLSLNAVTTACNQKSNRDPILSLSEVETVEAPDGLSGKRLAREKTQSGSRVTKYVHRLANTLGLTFDFSREELAVLCVLMLRGAQSIGEIRTRTTRLCDFGNLAAVEQTLLRLCERDDGPYVVKLPRQPGHKEPRYAHLLCGEVEFAQVNEPSISTVDDYVGQTRVDGDRLAALEHEVSELRREVLELRQRLTD